MQWFSLGPLVSSSKTDCHNITEILLKMALNIKPGMSIDFEVAGEIWKVTGKLMRTAQPSAAQSPLYGQGSGGRSGINGAKSCILGLSWHLISLLKLHFLVLFFSYIFFYIFLITCITVYSLLFEKAVQ
jgi:hypothetical protein